MPAALHYLAKDHEILTNDILYSSEYTTINNTNHYNTWSGPRVQWRSPFASPLSPPASCRSPPHSHWWSDQTAPLCWTGAHDRGPSLHDHTLLTRSCRRAKGEELSRTFALLNNDKESHITHHTHTQTHIHTHTTQYLFLLDNIFQKLPIWKSGEFSDTGTPSVSLTTLL